MKKIIINSKTFKKNIKVKGKCRKKIFEEYPNDSFIIVLDNNGKVVVYERTTKNIYSNLKEFISLFGSKFFKNKITDENIGMELKEYYEKKTGQTVRNIYKYNFNFEFE